MSIGGEEKNTPSYVIRLEGLDRARTNRIYKTLSNLSSDAVWALKNKDMKKFSIFTDKMRPLLSYVTTNSVKLSDHFDQDNIDSQIKKTSSEKDLASIVGNLRHNLKIIENARLAVSSIPFTPLIFSSEEITDAYLDYLLPLAWDFEYDAIILINLNDPRLLDYISARGQKRVFLIGGSLTQEIFDERLDKKGVSYWFHQDPTVIKDLIRSVTGRPPYKIISIDCGLERISPESAREMELEAKLGRTACWQRFNTVNRGDALGVLENLYNMTVCRQTSEFHGKFCGVPAIVVCPGPSLQKNIDTIKKIKGKALIICVLHALVYLQEKNIDPDIVIQVDPKDLKQDKMEKNGKETSVWDEWITKNDLSKVNHFVTSLYAKPEIFELPVKNIMWMNAGLPLGDEVPLSITDYHRVGGSVAHSAFDLMVEFGCNPIALVGQDLAYSRDGAAYASGGLGRKKGDQFMKDNYGKDVEVTGYYGSPVLTSEVFLSFANLFTLFGNALQSSNIRLFNCTEGGMYIEGFKNCSLEDFFNNECSANLGKRVDDVFFNSSEDEIESKDRSNKMKKFIGANINLTREISASLKKLNLLLKKDYKTDADIKRFNKTQKKVIKMMGQNYFYSLALQKNIHILSAGLRADSSVEGQLGFHKDFLEEVEVINTLFKENFSKQKNLFSNNSFS